MASGLTTTSKTITVDGETYVRLAEPGTLKIAILQRGWVMVGRFSQSGEMCKLRDASVIRVFGTTKGLGEIALDGPTVSTRLDPCGEVTFHILTTIAMIDCVEKKWGH